MVPSLMREPNLNNVELTTLKQEKIMPKFRIDRDVEQVNGIQVFEVEAGTLSEAIEKLKGGDAVIVDSEIEVTSLSSFRDSEVYESED